MAEDSLDLEAFLEADAWKGGGANCAVCMLPPEIRAKVEEVVSKAPPGRKRWRSISRWLKTQGLERTPAMLQYHFSRDHHVR